MEGCDRLLVRVSTLDGTRQRSFGMLLRERLLQWQHYTKVQGNPDGRRMYSTMRQSFY